MKYSIRGTLNIADGSAVIGVINKYQLWKFEPSYNAKDDTGVAIFMFEVWLNNATDKYGLWVDLKPFVDQDSGSIDLHECTHDEINPKPCNIIESYLR